MVFENLPRELFTLGSGNSYLRRSRRAGDQAGALDAGPAR